MNLIHKKKKKKKEKKKKKKKKNDGKDGKLRNRINVRLISS